MADREGQQLGNYHLIRLLGEGGFAEVYLGEHIYLKTQAAIKVLQMRLANEDREGFLKEARTIAGLKHPHIIRVLDFGIDAGTPFLVMDYAPNGTLRTRHPKSTTLPVSTVVGYVKQIAEALQYAHDRKVVHRDVKPENMLIGENNEILLSDFGIALIVQSSRYQSTKDMAGTIAYMAPEQISAHPSPASDQYALGIVAYEWLCGTRPFHGSFTEIAIKHSVIPPPPPSEHLPTLSSDVEHVILTALAKQPGERFASVSTFATALEQASQDMLPTERSRPLGSSSPLYTPTPQSHASMPPPRPTPQSQQLLPTQAQTTGKPTVSRRAFLVGAAGVAVIAAVGAGVFLVLREQSLQGYIVTPQEPTVTPQSQPFTYWGHSNAVRAVAWAPDGQRIASGSADKTVQVWNASDGGNVFTYRGHSATVGAVAWAPDGQRIASSSDDKSTQVWNANDGGNVFTYRGHSSPWVVSVAWSPDGKRIASGSFDRTVQVWNASNGGNVLTYTGHSDAVWSVAWSPDGKRIASGSYDKTVQVWNANDGGNVFTYRGHSSWVWSVAWSPDGKRIASSSGDNTVQVWNAIDGGNVFTYRGHSNAVKVVAWSPDGKRIASGSDDKTVQVWNANDGGNVFTYRGHSDGVWSVAWAPDGKRVASGSGDKTVQVWQAV